MNTAQAGLYVDQLTVTWRNGHTALRDASFSVPRGAIAALVGVNGSGKSTLLNLLVKNLTPTSGTIQSDGYTLLVPHILR